MSQGISERDDSAAVVERERQFHNERFSSEKDPRAHLNKWYASVRQGPEKQEKLLLELARNKAVLEYGCSDGWLSINHLRLPEICASYSGIDISDVAIQKATDNAIRAGYNNARFFAMNAEAMSFPDASFSVVFGRGIIHHLNLEKCFSEIARVLRPKGVAIFCEPMGHNPILNLYRKRTPEIRTADEHPLLMSDFLIARRHFVKVETSFYGLFSVASALFDRDASGMWYRSMKAVDDIVLRVPGLRRFAWHCLITCRKQG